MFFTSLFLSLSLVGSASASEPTPISVTWNLKEDGASFQRIIAEIPELFRKEKDIVFVQTINEEGAHSVTMDLVYDVDYNLRGYTIDGTISYKVTIDEFHNSIILTVSDFNHESNYMTMNPELPSKIPISCHKITWSYSSDSCYTPYLFEGKIPGRIKDKFWDFLQKRSEILSEHIYSVFYDASR